MTEAVLIAGGNLGDVRAALDAARGMVELSVGHITAASGIYTSEAWGFEAPERFMNQAWVVETALGPEELLDELEKTERRLGRTSKSCDGAYSSRKMDIDIIFYGDSVVDSPRLKIPHPLMGQRRFVLEPLCGLMPKRLHPVSGKSIEQLLAEL